MNDGPITGPSLEDEMGMYDYVDLGRHLNVCPHCGQRSKFDWQSKDSPDQLLTTYRFRDDGVLESQSNDGGYDDEKQEPQVVPADFCGVWKVHGCCHHCRKPVEAQIVIIDGSCTG